ncbi:protein kinase family protein [Streptosporangium sp. NBC_01469]|uniref:protein kinase family protein n=1 Tax=Streptosporangium sp. NBC_01469 TaxID=2903898 RepID=UPI002E29E2BC|nr:protein kinase family protein [Streptosporangium sp. NBC_01469]
MSSPAVEPGTKLAERFRLEDRVHESGGATLWKAIDEVLARPVAVHTFDPDFPRLNEVVTAARVASRLTDPRLTQVFDATEDDGHSYVVSEWVSGESFSDMIAGGPLDPERAAAMVAEAAEALAHAHEANLAHLCLTPEHLVWTAGSTVKLLGLGVDAVLDDVTSDDPAREDAEGLGRLLYAGLTGHWPGDEQDSGGLPVAPMGDGHFCTPRQVIAGVPGYLDAIVCRAMLPETRRGLDPLTTPAEVAEALASVSRPSPLPMPTPMPMTALPVAASRSEGIDTAAPQRHTPPPQQTQHQHRPMPQQAGGMVNKVAMTVVVLLVMVAVGLGAWTLGRSIGNAGTPTAGEESTTPTPTVEAAPREVKPSSVTGFDPLSTDREERGELAGYAVDGKESTDWHSESYDSADFGRLKTGVGLLLDMGKSIPVKQVSIEFGGTSGGTAELRVGDSAELEALDVVEKFSGLSGKKTFTAETPKKGRYVLVWFTKMPTYQGKYRGQVLDMKVLATK